MRVLGTGVAKLDILFQIGSNRIITFDFSNDVSAWSFEFVVKRNAGDRVKSISKTLSNGISFPVYDSNTINVTFLSSDTSLSEGEYYYELRRSDSNIAILSGSAFFNYTSLQGDDSLSELSVTTSTISVDISNNLVLPLTTESYSTTFIFDRDKDIFKDITGQTVTINLSSTSGINGVGIFFRANKGTSVTFTGVSSEAMASSVSHDPTKLNVYLLLFFSNWNNSGTPKVIYANSTFNAI